MILLSLSYYYDFRPILHKYANEDVSLGAWLIGLEVEHINDHNMCCRTPHGMQFPSFVLASACFMLLLAPIPLCKVIY